jgi:hypothetical protein
VQGVKEMLDSEGMSAKIRDCEYSRNWLCYGFCKTSGILSALKPFFQVWVCGAVKETIGIVENEFDALERDKTRIFRIL